MMVYGFDRTNENEMGRDIWRTVAVESRVPLKAIEVICSDTDLHKTRLERRRRGLRACPEPSWRDVLRRASEVEAWTTPRLVLASAGEPSAMLEEACRYLDA